MIECVTDGTHIADVALMLRDAGVTPRERRVALLEFANSARRRLRYPCRLRTSSIRRRRLAILRRGRWGRVPRWRRRRAIPRQLASHIRGRGEVRHGSTGKGVARSGCVNARVVDAWVVVVVCAWEGDGLVGGTRLGTTDVDLGAGWIELGSAECHG